MPLQRLMLLFSTFVLLCSSALMATPVVCPTIGLTTFETGGSPGNQPYLTAGGGCNILITIDSLGGISTSVVNSNAYDGVDDTLVGVVNNDPNPLTSLSLSGSGIFGFDGDGICIFAAGGVAGDTWSGPSSSYCTTNQLNGVDPDDYQGPTSTFAITDANDGIVNFAGGVAGSGGTTFFSLEEAPSVTNLTVGPGTPEPGTLWTLAAGLLGLSILLRKRHASS